MENNAYKKEVVRMLEKLDEKSSLWKIIYTVIINLREA